MRGKNNIPPLSGFDTSDATAAADKILSPYTAYGESGKLTGTMPDNGAVAQTLAAGDDYTIPKGYHNGSGIISAKPLSSTIGENVTLSTSENLLAGITAYGKNGAKYTGSMPNIEAVNHTLPINGSYTIPKGYHDGSGRISQSITIKSTETYTPTTSNQTIAAGRYLSGDQVIKGDSNLVAENIKKGISIFGVNGSYSISINDAKVLSGMSQTSFTSISLANNSSRTFTLEEKLSTMQQYLISPVTLYLGIWGDLEGSDNIISFSSSPLNGMDLPSIWQFFTPGGYLNGNWSGDKSYNMYLYTNREANLFGCYLKLTLLSDSQIKVENKTGYVIKNLTFNVYSVDFEI